MRRSITTALAIAAPARLPAAAGAQTNMTEGEKSDMKTIAAKPVPAGR